MDRINVLIAQALVEAALLGRAAVLASWGSVTLQDTLTRGAIQVLSRNGLPRRGADPEQVRRVALRLQAQPVTVTSPAAVAAVLRRAADWLNTQDYGPAGYRSGADIVEAVERHSSGRELYDTLSVVASAVHPSVTITAWEWIVNRSRSGAVELLRSVAGAPGSMVYAVPPAVIPGRSIRIDLGGQ